MVIDSVQINAARPYPGKEKKMINRVLKEKLAAEGVICGTHTGLNNAVLTEIMAGVGYDYLWIDTEHAPVDYAELLQMVGNAWNAGTPPIVRVTMNDRNHVKHVLEMGVAGIIFPMVDDAEQLDESIKYTLYPPDGLRGFGPQRAVRYGLDSELEYLKEANSALCRFAQIESPEGVDNLPKMVKNPWIDAFIIGPCDLSLRAGCPGDIYGETVTALIRRASETVRAAGKRLGLSLGVAEPDKFQHWRDLGVTMISTGNDYTFVLNGAKNNLSALRKL